MSVSAARGAAAALVSLASAPGWLPGRPPDLLPHQPGHQPALHAAERVEPPVRRIRAPMLPKCRRVTVPRGIAVRIRVTDPAGQAGADTGQAVPGPARTHDQQQPAHGHRTTRGLINPAEPDIPNPGEADCTAHQRALLSQDE